MTQEQLKATATKYVKKALETSEGKCPSPAKVKKTVDVLLRKFAHIPD